MKSTSVRTRLAQLLWLVCVVAALFLALGALTDALDANQNNALVSFDTDGAELVDLGVFTRENGIKQFTGKNADTKNALVNWGIGAIAWLVLGRILDKTLVLAEAVKKLGQVDLVVCGMASTDGAMSVVPAMLAERLGLPQVTLASLVETQGDQIRVKRDGDTATEVIGATLPVVLSVTDQTGEARYPSFKGIMAAKKKPVETYSLADLGVEAEKVGLSVAWSQVEETTARPPRTAGEIVTDEDGSGATALAEFLASKKFI